MLTAIEKIIFIVLATGCLGVSYFTFRKMFRVIGMGEDQINWIKVAKNWRVGINAFISQKTLFRFRDQILAQFLKNFADLVFMSPFNDTRHLPR